MEYSNFNTLRRDFDSAQLPSPYDPMTVRTLCRIADDIMSGKTTLREFEDFLTANNMERTPIQDRHARPFGDVCYDFVSSVVNYMEAQPNIVRD